MIRPQKSRQRPRANLTWRIKVLCTKRKHSMNVSSS